MTAKIRNVGFVPLLLTAWFFIGCERTTQVKIKGGTIPVFVLSGSGELAIFTVYGPDYVTKAEEPFDENFALWEIRPSGGYSAGTHIEDLGSVTYGVVPPGYVQARPQAGSPPPLTEGQKYFFRAETTNAPWAAGYVEIRNAKDDQIRLWEEYMLAAQAALRLVTLGRSVRGLCAGVSPQNADRREGCRTAGRF